MSREWLLVLDSDHQAEVGGNDADPEHRSGWNYAREKTRESRDPFQTGVAVVRLRVEKGDSGSGCELYGVVKL
jgi:hypothetical protein